MYDEKPLKVVEGVDTSEPIPPRSWNDIVSEVILLLPNLVKLFTRLMRDPRVPIRRKLFVASVAAYVLSPIDFVPDFIVGFGKIDDVILVSLAVDHLMRSVDSEIVLEHWDGSVDALDLVRSVFAWAADILPDSVRKLLPR
jgi:uncharacterized membrane protein YkvA (DUF1232 family)